MEITPTSAASSLLTLQKETIQKIATSTPAPAPAAAGADGTIVAPMISDYGCRIDKQG